MSEVNHNIENKNRIDNQKDPEWVPILDVRGGSQYKEKKNKERKPESDCFAQRQVIYLDQI